MTDHTFIMSEKQAKLVHQVVASHMAALKNWIVSAVERGDLAKAQILAQELREFGNLFAAFNMDAKYQIAEITGNPVEIAHVVRAQINS